MSLSSQWQDGVLCDWQISSLFAAAQISTDVALAPGQIQPASLDVRCADKAFRLRASFLPGQGKKVADCLSEGGLCEHTLDLCAGAVLETNCVYLIPLTEQLDLPEYIEGILNPKSSTGRIDVFVRVITDGATQFDSVPAGYKGPLYLEVSPRSFPTLIRSGDRLAQLRLIKGQDLATQQQIVSVDLSQNDAPSGWRARPHTPVLDASKIGQHSVDDFWEPVFAKDGRIILQPEAFYILKSYEAVQIPQHEAAEMQAIATELGEFRVHYAGFFDPGFGLGDAPSRAVLEVRCRDVPFVLDNRQAIARLTYSKLSAKPEALYGQSGNNYQGQGLRLSKHFRAD